MVFGSGDTGFGLNLRPGETPFTGSALGHSLVLEALALVPGTGDLERVVALFSDVENSSFMVLIVSWKDELLGLRG